MPTLLPKSNITIPEFNPQALGTQARLSRIGSGEIGGKAQGMALLLETATQHLDAAKFPEIHVDVPSAIIVAADHFRQFIHQTELHEITQKERTDAEIATAFQRVRLPETLYKALQGVATRYTRPLAIRSSSVLAPSAPSRIYGAKLIPNNHPDPQLRLRQLVETIQWIYAAAFFKEAQSYRHAVGLKDSEEQMAVIIQEMVGMRCGTRFYPLLSGVARSHNFYPIGHARPEDGVVNLALGLGKALGDGTPTWTYSPAYPTIMPPYNTLLDLMNHTQNTFWGVRLDHPTETDAAADIEFLAQFDLKAAEEDGTLAFAASTYDLYADRLLPGVHPDGPRLVNFAPLLAFPHEPFNALITELLRLGEQCLNGPVEIEFALTRDPRRHEKDCLYLLNLRSILATKGIVTVDFDSLDRARILTASELTLGHGIEDDITDIVYVKPDVFEPRYTPKIVQQLETINRQMVASGNHYVLIGFGRWGSSDAWLGIPVEWSRISAARVVVEASLPNMNVEISQGVHIFHNLTNLQILYMAVPFQDHYSIDWQWLNAQPAVTELEFVRHVRLAHPLQIRVDGRSRKGVILK